MLRSIRDSAHFNLIGANCLFQEQIWDRHKTPENLPSGSGKTIVITGGNRGIGYHAVQTFLGLEYHVIIGCRNPDRVRQDLEVVVKSLNINGTFECLKLDLLDLNLVKEFAENVLKPERAIHVLINNAGIMLGPRVETPEGFESQFMTNYLSHFLLTSLLLPAIKRSGTPELKSRIVNVTSQAHHLGSRMNFDDLQLRNSYTPEAAYANSKMAQILFTKYLQSTVLGDCNVTVNCVHPGVILTGLYTNVPWVRMANFLASAVMKTPEQGSDAIVHAAISPDIEGKSGVYLQNSQISSCDSFASSETNQGRLWDETMKLLNKTEF